MADANEDMEGPQTSPTGPQQSGPSPVEQDDPVEGPTMVAGETDTVVHADGGSDTENRTQEEMNTYNALTAARNHDFPLLRQILQTCAHLDVNKTDRIGWTPLHYATMKGEKELVQLLASHGADCNLKDKQKGRTALHYAVSKNHSDMVEMLLQCGADPRIEDDEQRSPGSLAKSEQLKCRLDEAETTFTEHEGQANKETKEIPCDRPTVFPGLGARVNPAEVSPEIARNWQGNTLTQIATPSEQRIPGSFAESLQLKCRLDEAVTTFTEHTGQANEEAKEIPCDRPTIFPGLGVSVNPANVSPETAQIWQGFTLSINKEPFDFNSNGFKLSDTEELCSDVFVYHVRRSPSHEVKLDVSVPVFAPPAHNEELVIRTIDKENHVATDVTQQNGTYIATTRLDLTSLTSLIVVSRPILERFSCGQNSSRIRSSVDSRVELDLEKGTFDSPTTITLEITDPPAQRKLEALLSQCDAIMSTTSFYSLEADGQPLAKPIMVKIPMTTNYNKGRLVVLSMDSSISEEKSEAWRIVDTSTLILAGRVEFPVSSFCVKVVVELTGSYSGFGFESSAPLLSQVSKVFRRSWRKEHNVVMFCLSRRIGTSNSFKLLVQCCKEEQYKTKQTQLVEEGFELHRERANEEMMKTTNARAKDRFTVQVEGLSSGNQNEVIEFHPKAENHKVFVLNMSNEERFKRGTVTVGKLNNKDGNDDENDEETVAEKVASVVVVLERFHPEMMNKRDGKSFLTNKRMLQLQEGTGDRWWKVFLLLDIPFLTLETYCKEKTSEWEVINGLLFDWRERQRSTKSCGIPKLLSALCKCGLRALTKDIQFELRRWKNIKDNQDEPFYHWLLMAYTHGLLLPTQYEKPMSDSFLAMVADLVPPSIDLAAALKLPPSVASYVIADNKTYPTAGLKTMKIFDVYQANPFDRDRTLPNLRHALSTLKLTEATHYIEQASAAWLKHSNKDEPMTKTVETFLSELNV